MKELILYAFALIVFSPATAADTIMFKTGFTKDVIIEEETPTSVKFRKRNHVVGVSRENIEKIEYATPKENEELKFQWRMEREQLAREGRRKREERKQFEGEQKGKGLVKIADRWVSPSELEELWQPVTQEEQSVEKPEEPAAASDEVKLPDFVGDIPEELTERYVESLRRLPKEQRQQHLEVMRSVTITSVRVLPMASGRTSLRVLVTNRSDFPAKQIHIGILCLDEIGNVLYLSKKILRNVRPKQSDILRTEMKVDYALIEDLKVHVVDGL